MTLNTYADIASIAPALQEDAIFVVREMAKMQRLITVFTDARGSNPRKTYEYTKATTATLAETDDLTGVAWTPALAQTLTPIEIGRQFFVTDQRADTQSPDNIKDDGARELGYAALDTVETALTGDLASLTGGTVGAAGTVITWGYLAAAIAQARNANKSDMIPLTAVIHGYQWAVLAKLASVAGATVAVAPNFQDAVTRSPIVGSFMGVDLVEVYAAKDVGDDFTGGVFPRGALAIDWRRPVRVEPQRDASLRGTEFNMSAVFAHGVIRPALGVKMIFDAVAPSS